MLKPQIVIETNTLEELEEEKQELIKQQNSAKRFRDWESVREYNYIIADVQFRIQNFEKNQE